MLWNPADCTRADVMDVGFGGDANLVQESHHRAVTAIQRDMAPPPKYFDFIKFGECEPESDRDYTALRSYFEGGLPHDSYFGEGDEDDDDMDNQNDNNTKSPHSTHSSSSEQPVKDLELFSDYDSEGSFLSARNHPDTETIFQELHRFVTVECDFMSALRYSSTKINTLKAELDITANRLICELLCFQCHVFTQLKELKQALRVINECAQISKQNNLQHYYTHSLEVVGRLQYELGKSGGFMGVTGKQKAQP
eukprot:PhF_6_TR9172/c1_g1_i2/m.14282